jgi:hypothetical protein
MDGPKLSAYQKLSNSNVIRLLQICDEETHRTNVLTFKFKPMSLNMGTKPYVALSYTWGDPRDEDEITFAQSDSESRNDQELLVKIDNFSFQVQPNLGDALKELYSMKLCHALWIDAICINQQNPREKSSQIALMGQIYTNAEQVIVWLGRDLRHDGSIISASLLQLSCIVDNHELMNSLNRELPSIYLPNSLKKFGLHNWSDDQMTSLGLFFTRRWFRRLWCLQEVLLASIDGVKYLYGHTVLSHEDVLKASVFLSRSRICTQLIWHLNAKLDRFWKFNSPHGMQPALITMVGSLFDPGNTSRDAVFNSLSGYPVLPLSAGGILLLLSFITRPWEVSESRDKVFALLGLCKVICLVRGLHPPNIEPDYSSTTVDVFKKTSHWFLEDSGSLALLSLVSNSGKEITASNPSWTLDFSKGHETPLLVQGDIHRRKYDASKNNPSKFTVSLTTGVLHTAAIEIGIISDLHVNFSTVQYGVLEECLLMILLMPELSLTGHDRIEIFWATILGYDNSIANGSILSDTTIEQCKAWLRLIIQRRQHIERHWEGPESLLKSRNEDFLSLIDEVVKLDSRSIFPNRHEIEELWKVERSGHFTSADSQHAKSDIIASESTMVCGWSLFPRRKLFLTCGRRLGLGPELSRSGDRVFIVKGASIPFVLRPATSNSSKSGFAIVGEAFVHGLMGGEVFYQGGLFRPIDII